MKRLQSIIIVSQNISIIFSLTFFAWDLTTQDYTNFTASPPNRSDKIWYLSEAIIFIVFATNFLILNKGLVLLWGWASDYIIIWQILALFFLIRLIWIIIWVTFGLSANLNIAQAILFSIVLASIFCITFLPYIRKIFKSTK